MKYLVDTSALVRIWRSQVEPEWRTVARRGLIGLCEPVVAETLLAAEAGRYQTAERELYDTYAMAVIPEDIWDRTAAIRRILAPHGVHRALSVTDLVVAATAMRLRLRVLHEDRDFETVARYVPELQQHRVSAGPE